MNLRIHLNHEMTEQIVEEDCECLRDLQVLVISLS